MISWALAERTRADPPVDGLDWALLERQAEASLRRAVQLDPGNTQYRLSAGRYLLLSPVPLARLAAEALFDTALTTARAASNAVLRAEAAVEVGRAHWRRYDALANRRLELTPGTAIRSIWAATRGFASSSGTVTGPLPLKALRRSLETNTSALTAEWTGGAELHEAEALFREATDADPASVRAFRQLAIALADQERWHDLELIALSRSSALPQDPWGWMALGLAMQRQSNTPAAATSFESALRRFEPQERERLDHIERILRHADTGAVSKGTDASQLATRRLYWLFADPLWSREGNESRIEFLARVAYAELRWSVDELGVRGVDTDRGDVFVRYGPPNFVGSFVSDPAPSAGSITTVWAYDSGLMFAFTGAPLTALAQFPASDQAYVAEVEELQPVRWDNLTAFHIDSMPTQIARFRATRDSVDVVIAAEPATVRIKASAQSENTPRADVWLLAGGTTTVFRDSTLLTDPRARVWTRRVKTGNYVYRIEASTDRGQVAGRATAPVVTAPDVLHGFPTTGQGISDVLLARRADPLRNALVRRWIDLDVEPVTTWIPHNGSLTLVWENYDFGVREGTSVYRVGIIIERERQAAGRLVAKVVSGITGTVGVERTDDRVAMRFERTMPHALAIADYVTIALEDTPAGNYRLTLEIADQVTGRTHTRSTNFTIQR
jgi:GWxTD domain-containing protein